MPVPAKPRRHNGVADGEKEQEHDCAQHGQANQMLRVREHFSHRCAEREQLFCQRSASPAPLPYQHDLGKGAPGCADGATPVALSHAPKGGTGLKACPGCRPAHASHSTTTTGRSEASPCQLDNQPLCLTLLPAGKRGGPYSPSFVKLYAIAAN